MSRIKDLQKQVFKVLADTDEPMKAMAHLHGVSLAAVMIAKKRSQDPELAAMAGLLHDLWAYKSGSYDDHAHLGADYARKVLGKMEITTSDETDIICDAIWHHDDKANVDSSCNDLPSSRSLGAQSEGKKDDRQKHDCAVAEQVPCFRC